MPVAVIFDVDGTLTDTVDLHAGAWQEALRDFGFDVPYDDIRSQIGKGGDQLLPVFVPPDALREQGTALEEHRSRLYKERYLPRAKGLPGARALIERLRSAGVEVAVASSAHADELGRYLRLAGVDDLVPTRAASEDAARSKPHPDIFEAALAKLGRGPEDVLVVGDSPYDAEAAAKAGMETIAVRSGGFPDESLKAAGARWIYEGLEALARDFERSPLSGGARPTGPGDRPRRP
jgi:HAD superfamily hydrolase (TIGR01509 family)